jgi:hypothetical protein
LDNIPVRVQLVRIEKTQSTAEVFIPAFRKNFLQEDSVAVTLINRDIVSPLGELTK